MHDGNRHPDKDSGAAREERADGKGSRREDGDFEVVLQPIENGKRRLTAAHVEKIARALGVPVSEIYGEAGTGSDCSSCYNPRKCCVPMRPATTSTQPTKSSIFFNNHLSFLFRRRPTRHDAGTNNSHLSKHMWAAVKTFRPVSLPAATPLMSFGVAPERCATLIPDLPGADSCNVTSAYPLRCRHNHHFLRFIIRHHHRPLQECPTRASYKAKGSQRIVPTLP